jgi:ketosteroid isomerase-like protein
MATTNFVDRETVIVSSWLNDVDENIYTAGAGPTSRTVKQKFTELINAKDFGVVADGTTDDTTAMTAAVTYIKANGGILFLPPGTIRCRNIQMGAGTKSWAIIGAGKRATVLEHLDGNGTFLNGAASSVGYCLKGFTINCKHSVYAHASANHGIAIVDTSNVLIEDVHITDWKNAAVLIYATNPATHKNCVLNRVSADGLGNAANGMLFAEVDYCGYTGCSITGLSKDNGVASPGYGLQFKNDCRYGYMTDCDASNCTVGVGFGNDDGAAKTQYCTLQNIRISDCEGGFEASYMEHMSASNIYIDMASSNAGTYPGESGLNLDTNCKNNSFVNVIVRNVRNVRQAVRFRSGATDNYVHFSQIDEINTTGKVAIFDTGSQYNHVRLSRMVNPRVRTGDIYSMVTFTTASDNNSWEYDGYPMIEAATIASGVITVANPKTTLIIVDTESAGATDDLDTITTNWAREGQVIVLRCANDARDVVVKHLTGNINLAGAADFTLGIRGTTLTLMYNAAVSQWCETSRSTNS